MSKNTSLLLVEDDLNFGLILKDQLESLGHSVKWETNGEDGIKAASTETFHLILLDIMMPKKDGLTMLSELREVDDHVPVIMITAKSAIENKKQGFEAGADDYLTKPFEIEELDLRINALLKRILPTQSKEKDHWQLGNFTFQPDLHLLTIEKEEKKLTARETAILLMLCKHKNETLDRSALLNAVWGNDNYFNGRSLDVYISKLRKYLSADDNINIINIHGKGFRLNTT